MLNGSNLNNIDSAKTFYIVVYDRIFFVSAIVNLLKY